MLHSMSERIHFPRQKVFMMVAVSAEFAEHAYTVLVKKYIHILF